MNLPGKLTSLTVASLVLALLPSANATNYLLDFDYAYFLPSDVTGGYTDFSADVDFVYSPTSPTVNMGKMALWDTSAVNWWERNLVGKGAYNDILSEIDWNNGDVDGNGGSNTTPNYKGINVGDMWKGLGIQIIPEGTKKISIMDSHDYILNDGTSGDSGHIKNGAGGSGGDGDDDNLTGNDPNVVAEKNNPNAPNNTAPNALNLGNLIVFEEGAGDAIPDDTAGGGILRFEIDDEQAFSSVSVEARIDQFRFVDDAKGSIALTFLDGTTLTKSSHATLAGLQYSGTTNNQIFYVDIGQLLANYDAANNTNYATANLDYFTVDYDNSGGLGEIDFQFLNTAPPPVPESSTIIGAGTLILLFAGRLVHKKKQAKLA